MLHYIKRFEINKDLLYKKYDKNIIYKKIHNNITKVIDYNELFYKSLPYISDFQKQLSKRNIENYISGGFALKLYLNDYVTNNKNILLTKDCDIILLYEEDNFYSNKIISNINYILNSVLYFSKDENHGMIKLYTIIDYCSKPELNYIIKYIINEGYDLILYNSNFKKKRYNINFIRKINNEFYIKIEIKVQNIPELKKKNIYSYNILNYFSFIKKEDKYIIYDKYIPMELLVINKKYVNTDIFKNVIKVNNYVFNVYNIKFLIYNLMLIYYNYKYNKENKGLLIKKEQNYNIRDEKRLYYLLKLYCNKKFNITNENNIKIIFNDFKLNENKFKIYMFKIKNLEMIDDIIINTLQRLRIQNKK